MKPLNHTPNCKHPVSPVRGLLNRAGLLFGMLMLLSLLFACDKIEEPYGEKFQTDKDTGKVKRNILLEDFTGHTCGNCPEAAAVTEQLVDLYGDQIIPVAVHVGFFADPAGSKYSANYKTTAGSELAAHYGIGDVLPKGMINRMDFDGKTVLDHGDWLSKVSSLIAQEAELTLSQSASFNASSRELSIDISFRFVQKVQEELKYVVYLLEDSLNSPQKNYAIPEGEILNYYHRHVLRTSLNGTWGEVLGAGNEFTVGQILSQSKTYTIPANWNEKRISVVTVVYRVSDRSVMQCGTIPVPKL